MLAIYCRTSKNRPEKYTIDDQRDGGIACANALGIESRFYIDDGISGTLDESVRDGLSDLFKDMRKKDEITHVYCIDQSRIERDTRTWEFFVALCLNNNIKYYPTGSFFDLDNPTNRMYASLMSIVNAYYSEITSKKVRSANARKAKKGKTHGLKAYGYKRDSNNNYIVYEPEAKNVTRMFELSLKGCGTYTIANIFNEEGIPTKFSGNFTGNIKRKEKYTKKEKYFDKSKVKWRGNVIYDMLRNEIYKGIRKWRRHEDKIEIVDGKIQKRKDVAEEVVTNVPPIVTTELWDKVNNNFENNKKNVGKKAHYKYLLNEIIICADCNRDYVGKKRLASGDNAYKCKGKIYPHPDCNTSRGISINKLDSFIIKHLFISKSLKRHLQNLPEDNITKNTLTQRLSNEENVLQRKKSELETAYKRLLNPLFTNDKHIESHVITLRSTIEKQQKLVDALTNEVNLMAQAARKNRVKNLINSYVDGIDFDKIKKLVHSLIDWIKIKHHKTDGKIGSFIIEIKYRGYDETSIFLTNWKADKWMWVSNHRSGAFTDEQKKEDKKETLAMYKYYGLETKGKVLKPLTIGTSSMKAETIELTDKDIVYFD